VGERPQGAGDHDGLTIAVDDTQCPENTHAHALTGFNNTKLPATPGQESH